MATTGRRPAMASPAARATECCSAIPVSITRSGNSSAIWARPVEETIAAEIPTSSGWRLAASATALPTTSVSFNSDFSGCPVVRSKVPTPCSLSTASSIAGW